MGTKRIINGTLIIVIFSILAGFISTPPKVQTLRGKVLTSGESNIKTNDLMIIKASFSPLEIMEDSTGVIGGEICILNDKNKPTGNTLPFQPRRFPKWFEFGCEDEGDFIEYKIVANGKKAVITHIPKRKKKNKKK